MQWAAGPEDRFKQSAADGCIDLLAAFDEATELDIPFNGDDRPELVAAEKLDRLGDGIDGLVLVDAPGLLRPTVESGIKKRLPI